MRETIFTATLLFSLMAGGATAIGNEMLRARRAPQPAVAVITLPMVTVTAHRAARTSVSPTRVAVETVAQAAAPVR